MKRRHITSETRRVRTRFGSLSFCRHMRRSSFDFKACLLECFENTFPPGAQKNQWPGILADVVKLYATKQQHRPVWLTDDLIRSQFELSKAVKREFSRSYDQTRERPSGIHLADPGTTRE